MEACTLSLLFPTAVRLGNPLFLQHGDEVALQVLAEKPKYLQCKGYWCTQSTGSGLFMETHDWGEYPSATFRIFRHRGKGAIRAGEVVAFYYPKDVKWMTCNGKWCFKNTCPGSPNNIHGMESSEKWQACSDNVFKIYARGRKLGERLRRRHPAVFSTVF